MILSYLQYFFLEGQTPFLYNNFGIFRYEVEAKTAFLTYEKNVMCRSTS